MGRNYFTIRTRDSASSKFLSTRFKVRGEPHLRGGSSICPLPGAGEGKGQKEPANDERCALPHNFGIIFPPWSFIYEVAFTDNPQLTYRHDFSRKIGSVVCRSVEAHSRRREFTGAGVSCAVPTATVA